MYTSEALLDLHERAHRGLKKMIAHCGAFGPEEWNRALDGFGYETLRLQLHHMIGAEHYWVGVLFGEMLTDDNSAEFQTAESLEGYRREVAERTAGWLRSVSEEELTSPRTMKTWRDEVSLRPAHVILRTQTHIFQHQGQVTAMCRLLGRPLSGIDFPMD